MAQTAAAPDFSFDDTLERLKREQAAAPGGAGAANVPPAPANPDFLGPLIKQQNKLLEAGNANIANFKKQAAPLLDEERRVANTPVAVPPAPAMNALPPAPNLKAIVQPMRDMSSMMMFLSLAGGALTGQPLIGALKAGTAYVNGVTSGDLRAANIAQQDFKNHLNEAIETNTEKLEQYRSVMENSHLKIDEKQMQMYGIAQRFGDLHTITLLQNGHIGLAMQALSAQAKAQESLLQHQDAQNAQWERLVDSKWQIVQDAANPDKNGNPTTFLYNPVLKKSETLNGAPYTPKGSVGKVSAPTTPLTPQAIAYAGTILRRTGAMPPMGMSAGGGDRQKIINYAASASPDDPNALVAIATQVQYKGGAQSVKQLTVMLGATKQALAQLDFNANAAKAEMAKLKSTNLSPIFNAIERGEEKWTGDPAYSALFYYLNGVAMESARIMSGGQASVQQLHEGAAEEARKWANMNMTPASFDAVVQAIHAEAAQREVTFSNAIRSQQAMIAAPPSSQPGAPSAPPSSAPPKPPAAIIKKWPTQ